MCVFIRHIRSNLLHIIKLFLSSIYTKLIIIKRDFHHDAYIIFIGIEIEIHL